jgi:hypothetical protein
MKKNDWTFYFKKSLAFIVFVLTIIIATPAAKAAAGLDIPLFVTDNAGGSKTLYFGLDGWATDNLDPSIGEATYPPLPPKGVFDARFNLPNGVDDSLKDYRHMGGINYNLKAVYSVQFQPGNGKTITLKWNLPANTTGTLQDAFTGSLINVAMSGPGSYEVLKPDTFNKLMMTINYNFYNTPPSVPVLDTGANSTSATVTTLPVVSSTPVPPIIPPTINSTTGQQPKTKNASLDIPLTITDGSSRMQTLRFGLDAFATDGLDNSLGEFTYPPMPPQGIFDARFNLPTGEDDTLADYRYLDNNNPGKKTYTIQYQPSEGHNTMSLNWSLPANVTGKLQDVLGGQTINVPMENNHSYTVLDPVKYNKLAMTIDYSSLFATTITAPNLVTSATATPIVVNPPVVNYPPTIVAASSSPTRIQPLIVFPPSITPPIINYPPDISIHIIDPNKPLLATATPLSISTISSKTIEQTQNAISDIVAAPQISAAQFTTLSVQARSTLEAKYEQVYKKAPGTTKDWTDAALIVSGHAPQTKVVANEATAKKIFVQVYKTQPSATSPTDQKVITSLAYSLEPITRSLPLEQKALTVYVRAYKRLPKSTTDWSIVKAVAYSGKVK